MASDNPLSLDPLSSSLLSSSIPSSIVSAPSPPPSASWTRHDFDAKPFSRWDQEFENGGVEESADTKSTTEADGQAAVNRATKEWQIALPEDNLSPNGILPAGRAASSSSSEDDEAEPAIGRPTAPISMRSASSLSRERTSSTIGLRDGRRPNHQGHDSISSSSPSSWEATPKGTTSPFTQRIASDRILTLDTDLSSTPSASVVNAHRQAPSVRADRSANGLDVEALKRLVFSAVSSGDLDRLKLLMSPTEDEDYPSPFVQSNWCNSEGETPIHIAAYRGHLNIAMFLEESGASVEVGDKDGWTALHNASSRGFLDIVRWLVEDAGALIDRRSKHGYSALMNAASRGHLPIIQFLTIKHHADPLLRNEWGETAFDLAAAVLEVEICAVLASYEASVWTPSPGDAKTPPSYNPLALHSTVPVVLHENQRLARPTLKNLSLGVLATGQAPRWSSKALSRNDDRTAFTMPTHPGLRLTNQANLPVFRSEVGLPIIGKEDALVLPAPREVRSGGRVGRERSSTVVEGKRPARPIRTGTATSALTAVLGHASASASPLASPTIPSNTTFSDGGELAWFWLSDWLVDLTDQSSSAVDGWSYASSFDAPPEEWSVEPPEDLKRLLESGGTLGFGGKKYVRRRRWVRVMRRRLDLQDWGFDGRKDNGGSRAADSNYRVSSVSGDMTPPDEDYLVRAQFLAGTTFSSDRPSSIRSGKTVTRGAEVDSVLEKAALRKVAARLERAADELRAGTLGDENGERRRRAQDQLEAFLHQLALIRVELGSNLDEDDDDSDDEFIYSGRDADPDDDARSTWTANGPTPRSPSVLSRRSVTSDYFSQPTSSLVPSSSAFPDLTPELSRAPEFRVPTHETSHPRHDPAIGFTLQTVPDWEPDDATNECRRCDRKFSFFLRKHHCRRCGQVVCANCSTHSDQMNPSQVVRVPGALDDEPWLQAMPFKYRTCDTCHVILSLPQNLGSSSSLLTTGAFFPRASSVGSVSPSDAGRSETSEVSELADCPVCGTILATLGGRSLQEEHIRDCLDTGGGQIASNGRYLVFKLPPGPLVEEECKICFCEFEVGDNLARMPCLCCFHRVCIRAWLDRGKDCPFHASRNN